MVVRRQERLTDPRCDDTVMGLQLAMPNGSEPPAFLPGQYVRLAAGEDQPSAYFSIASAPRERADGYTFFVKCQGAAASALCAIRRGERVRVQGPMGKGFRIDDWRGRDIYLIGVGTGIAPLRSIWREILPRRADYGRIAIYAGFRTPLHRLLTDELDALAGEGIEVSVTLEIGGESWDGPIGYVQHQIARDRPSGENAIAVLSGMNAMVEACRALLLELGFAEERILTNHG
ncbi:MAG: hydrogenase [Zetaproteobacteria bacterium]|nr:MAG: hydrogenase [Zetaproteobacteria bacterium]